MNDKLTLNELKDREVVNVCDGKRYGYVCDVEIDICTGRVLSLIIPGELKCFGFVRGEDYCVLWENVERVGDDIILVSSAKLIKRDKPKPPVKQK